MKIQLTKQERTDLLREVLAGTIETDHYKRLFKQWEQPLFYIKGDGQTMVDEDATKSNEVLKKEVKELLRKCDGLI